MAMPFSLGAMRPTPPAERSRNARNFDRLATRGEIALAPLERPNDAAVLYQVRTGGCASRHRKNGRNVPVVRERGSKLRQVTDVQPDIHRKNSSQPLYLHNSLHRTRPPPLRNPDLLKHLPANRHLWCGWPGLFTSAQTSHNILVLDILPLWVCRGTCLGARGRGSKGGDGEFPVRPTPTIR